MKVSQFTDYALRVLIHVGSRPGERVSIAAVTDAYGVSRNHLNKVVRRLQEGGYLLTFRGRGGGVELALPADQLRIGVLVEDLENLQLVECFRADSRCPLTSRCILQTALEQARRAFLDALNRYTLADLLLHGSTLGPSLTASPRR
ncbi:MAG: Rrf2 family transcriptional regulator [Planctomycetes bacterium]|nr:Rrf2 family transcriptional regulator [Planctomycetota bacterium]